LRKFSINLVPGPLIRYLGVPIYEKEQSLVPWLRLLVRDPPVLSVKTRIEAFNQLQSLIRILCNILLCPEIHIYRLGEVPIFRVLQLDPSSQPVIVNGHNESVTRLVVGAHIN
jgi:hypothetical protein